MKEASNYAQLIQTQRSKFQIAMQAITSKAENHLLHSKGRSWDIKSVTYFTSMRQKCQSIKREVTPCEFIHSL